MSTTEAQIDVGATSPAAMPSEAADSSPALETSPAPENAAAGSVSTENGGEQAQPQEIDIFADIPSIEELQQQVERREPRAEGLLRLRTELERISPEYTTLSKYKPLVDLGTPEELQAAYDLRSKLFSPVIDEATGQPKYDARGLQQRTSHPWVEAMESETPGFFQRHLDDLLRYVDPVSGKNGAQMYFSGIGLDIDRFDDYLNIDSLIAKSSGAVTEAELATIAEGDREAYSTLPASLRREWAAVDDDEKRYHLDGAKERLENKRWREQQETERQQAEQVQQQQFQQKLYSDITSDLSTVRTQGLTSLRDSISKAVVLSSDPNTQSAYIDAIVTPLALLLHPDFSDLGSNMLTSMGVKLDASFNDALNAFVTARQQYVIAKAYGEEGAAATALKEADGKFARIMAKFNDLALKRAATFGYQAKQIATANGNTLAAATARPMAGNGSAVEAAHGILPAGIDPYSPEANKFLWSQTQQRGQ